MRSGWISRNTIAMRAQILEMASRPEGASREDFDGMRMKTVMGHLQKMEQAGALFGHALWHTPRRYFATEAARDAYAKENRLAPKKAKPDPVAFKGARAWWPADAQPVITSQTKVTIAPTPPRPLRTGTHNQFN